MRNAGGSASDDGGEDGEDLIGDAGDHVIPHTVGSDNDAMEPAAVARCDDVAAPNAFDDIADLADDIVGAIAAAGGRTGPFHLPAFLRRVP